MAKNPLYKSSTGYRGVYRQGNRFNAQIGYKGKSISKMFGDPIEAAYWWDEQARKLRGQDTETNESLGLIPKREPQIIVKPSRLTPPPVIPVKGAFDPKPDLNSSPSVAFEDDEELDERQPDCLCDPGFIHPATVTEAEKPAQITALAQVEKVVVTAPPIEQASSSLMPYSASGSLNPDAATMRAEALRMLAFSVELESKGDIRGRLAPVYGEVNAAITMVRTATEDMIEGLAMLETASNKLKELLA
ncbi:hypothetical protein ACJVQT_22925 [Enterobacter huaxiensis]|uniref:hypothetical protein n=1 Tax=Enterobacter huaxiensis TaxID=2494702 RepID=UPI0021759CBD|nr:hypothetical protein [Enterobacter huaxiensis]MCS5452521.1 hypothetical protein [Enterobacter huaxiensis]